MTFFIVVSLYGGKKSYMKDPTCASYLREYKPWERWTEKKSKAKRYKTLVGAQKACRKHRGNYIIDNTNKGYRP